MTASTLPVVTLPADLTESRSLETSDDSARWIVRQLCHAGAEPVCERRFLAVYRVADDSEDEALVDAQEIPATAILSGATLFDGDLYVLTGDHEGGDRLVFAADGRSWRDVRLPNVARASGIAADGADLVLVGEPIEPHVGANGRQGSKPSVFHLGADRRWEEESLIDGMEADFDLIGTSYDIWASDGGFTLIGVDTSDVLYPQASAIWLRGPSGAWSRTSHDLPNATWATDAIRTLDGELLVTLRFVGSGEELEFRLTPEGFVEVAD